MVGTIDNRNRVDLNVSKLVDCPRGRIHTASKRGAAQEALRGQRNPAGVIDRQTRL